MNNDSVDIVLECIFDVPNVSLEYLTQVDGPCLLHPLVADEQNALRQLIQIIVVWSAVFQGKVPHPFVTFLQVKLPLRQGLVEQGV